MDYLQRYLPEMNLGNIYILLITPHFPQLVSYPLGTSLQRLDCNQLIYT